MLTGLMGERPIIKCMRYPVGDIYEILAGGMTTEGILMCHILERKDIQVAILNAE